jgi:hypothetical protein
MLWASRWNERGILADSQGVYNMSPTDHFGVYWEDSVTTVQVRKGDWVFVFDTDWSVATDPPGWAPGQPVSSAIHGKAG